MAKYTEARVLLNIKKPSNNTLFCPVNRMHLTISSPMGVIHTITPQLLLEFRDSNPGILDIDGRIDIKAGEFKDVPAEVMAELKEMMESGDGLPVEDNSIIVEEVTQDGKKKKKLQ